MKFKMATPAHVFFFFFFDALVVLKFLQENYWKCDELFCYQRAHTFAKSCQKILMKTQKKSEDIEKSYSVLINDKKMELLIC